MYNFLFLANNKHELKNSLKGGFVMASQKHLYITGTSNVSWKDAIVQAVAEASKTIDYLTSVKVLEQRATISGKKLSEFFVDLDLVFTIDRERED